MKKCPKKKELLKRVVVTFSYLDNWSHYLKRKSAKDEKKYVREKIIDRAEKLIATHFSGNISNPLWTITPLVDHIAFDYKGRGNVSDIKPKDLKDIFERLSDDELEEIFGEHADAAMVGKLRLPGRKLGTFKSINPGAILVAHLFVSKIKESIQLGDPTFGDRVCKIDYNTGLWKDSFSMDLADGDDPILVDVKVGSKVQVPVPIKVTFQWWEEK